MSWQDRLAPSIRAAHAAWVARGFAGEGRLVLDHVDLSHARLSGPRLQRAAFTHCTFDDASFTYVDITGGDLLDCSGARPRFGYLTLREGSHRTLPLSRG